MAFQGPAYGLSRECFMKAQAKFDMDRAIQALNWIREVTNLPLESPDPEKGFRDQLDFCECLKDGQALCTLINVLQPKSIPKINTMSQPFKQRENLEMFLRECEKYGLKSLDLFQVNDLYEKKNLYTVVNCIFALGGLAQKNGFDGPTIGVKVSEENKRSFDQKTLNMRHSIIGLQAGTNKGASQAGMRAYGLGRQILPNAKK